MMGLDAKSLDAYSANDNRISMRERVEGYVERARDRVSITTGLLIVCLLVGAGVGAAASKPFHRADVNREWRERIAKQSAGVRAVLAKSNADAEALDTAIIAELGVYDARLSSAELALAHASRNAGAGRGACDIDTDRLRE